MNKFKALAVELEKKAKWWDNRDDCHQEMASMAFIALMEVADVINKMVDDKKKKRKR